MTGQSGSGEGRSLEYSGYQWYTTIIPMAPNPSGWSRSGKVKLSAAVLGWTVEVLERFRRDLGLPTRSAALSEVLAQWAREYSREAAVERVLAKYGKLYNRAAAAEAKAAARFLPLFKRTKGVP